MYMEIAEQAQEFEENAGVIREFKEKWQGYFDIENENVKRIKITARVYINSFGKTTKIDDNIIKSLIRDFIDVLEETKQEEIEQFDMDLSWSTKITDDALKEIASLIESKYTNNIRDFFSFLFEYNVHSCFKITDEGVTHLAQQISNLRHTQRLELSFQGCQKITDSGVSAITQHIGSNLKALQHLHLDFYDCNQMTDYGVKQLAMYIRSDLMDLQYFHLNLGYCQQITHNGFREIIQHIGSHLQNLQHLRLEFFACIKFNDSLLRELAHQICSNLKALESLYLNFYGCQWITDYGFKELCYQIGSKLDKIKHLNLIFRGTQVREKLKSFLQEGSLKSAIGTSIA